MSRRCLRDAARDAVGQSLIERGEPGRVFESVSGMCGGDLMNAVVCQSHLLEACLFRRCGYRASKMSVDAVYAHHIKAYTPDVMQRYML